ncbi:probable pyruvate dehydrogenase E1 component subunit alpha, mitochondrial [Trichoplusia ni]|uniref:pyruvate dehydrogenase (acetyl-transferring) n=1 Tax=Trichoplusia ni TaxID=7111 RepID=A0A7E5W6C8_TRINI|nr:probable pyruvate dehydrogenase E1 component subunit alpha, mitochondrial [Trichoplusia ni]
MINWMLQIKKLDLIAQLILEMSKIIPSAAKLLASRAVTKAGILAPVAPKIRYSTKNEASIEIKPYKLHKLDKGPPTSSTITHKEALALYEKLVVLRRLETAASNMYKAKVIQGFCHLYLGEEAVAVGICSVMRPIDTVCGAYRCHGWTHLMGASELGVLAELAGRKSGCGRGKGGSMHMYTPRLFGGNGIVGATGPLGAGIAFAHKYKGTGGVNFALYGDGSANQGQVHEAFNMAKLWVLPCIFLCENNGYGLGTAAKRSSASTEYYARGDYIPGIKADGMDVVATREVTKFAIDWCASGKGPIVVEFDTYRYTGHSMSDPGTSYRSREEVAEVRAKRDPITSFKEKLLKAQLATAEQLKAIDSKVKKSIDAATKQAKADAVIGPEELTADIYYSCLEKEIRGTHPGAPRAHLALSKRAS